ncbi:hypothetical protein CWR43_17195 [Rhizobium sullae]|uniref:Uncharacterized protein n=1 Tax=Rhizobium sullae TaxID=50338 RepID=A0A2N0D859_RHISU|nr:hypothetical protein CWR43_17195 [Rhizobium sullae]
MRRRWDFVQSMNHLVDERHHIEASWSARRASEELPNFVIERLSACLSCTLTAFINSVCSFN